MERSEIISPEVIIEAQAKFYEQIGLWNNGSRGKFNFRLSPDQLPISEAQQEELKLVSQAIFAEKGFLRGGIALFEKTLDPRFTSRPPGNQISRILRNGISRQEIDMQDLFSDRIPFICRLDLIATDGNDPQQPSFQIVEVEGDKTHAFGYVSMPVLFRNAFFGENNSLGIVEAFRQERDRLGINSNNPIILIVGQSEEFYQKELDIFSRIAQSSGVNIVTAAERDLDVLDGKVLVRGTQIESDILVSLPTLTPGGFKSSGINADKLKQLYKLGDIKTLIPPKRFLGNKGLLGLIKNSTNDPLLERVLNEVFDSESLAILRRFIPETKILKKVSPVKLRSELEALGDEWVIKNTMSSGMRGVSLSSSGSDQDKRAAMINQAVESPYSFIVQKKVSQKTMRFNFSESTAPFNQRQAQMFMRISPYVTRDGIAAIGVTAREVPSVHGATDAIQIPVLFERSQND